MNTEKMLKELMVCIESARGRGNTTAMMQGAKNTDCITIVPVLSHAKNQKQQFPESKNEFISLCQLEKIRGTHKPITADISTLQFICSDALNTINELKNELNKIYEITSKYKGN